jgi:ribosomal protein S18 acetylase RimI-like enzyme
MKDVTNKIMANETYYIERATEKDLEEMDGLYNALHDFLQVNINYPGWIKGVYPTRETAANGIEKNNLFVLKINNEIAGSIILNHSPETAYTKAEWGIEMDYDKIIVIHSLAVHPRYMKKGVGKRLMDYAKSFSMEHKMKSIRLDVSIHNTPAIKLYEKCGYQFIDTVDLGLNIPDLIWFHLFEIIL